MSGLAALAPPPLPNAKATQPEPPLLPNETLVAIFGELGLADLLTLRRASRKFKALAEFLLADLLQKVIAEQRRAKNLADAALRESEREKRPRMQHYRWVGRPLAIVCH